MQDGNELTGWGMATGIWEAMQMKTAARIALTANGHAEVSCATADIGTGTYTIMTQLAADMLGLPLESITAKLRNLTGLSCDGAELVHAAFGQKFGPPTLAINARSG